MQRRSCSQWAYALVAVGKKHKSAKDAKAWAQQNQGSFFERTSLHFTPPLNDAQLMRMISVASAS